MSRPRGAPDLTAAEQLAQFAVALRAEALPADVAEAAKLHLLDFLGCALAAHALGVATEARTVMAEAGGEGQATVVGHAGRLPAASAALANGMLGHGLDYDDTHPDSVCHVTAVVGPAALAAGEARGAPGTAVLAALVAGSEAVARIGRAASGVFHARGFHPTAVCGVFGATLAAARVAGLDPAGTTRALGLAGSTAAGLLAYLTDGTPTKPFHAGWAAHAGVIAARLAAAGAAGPRSVLEGRYGFFHAFLGDPTVDLGPELADLGTRWETRRIAYKPYPACHLMHGALAATAEAAGGRTFAPTEVEEVWVEVPEPVVPIVCEPVATKVAPRTAYEAKFALQYSAAAMLIHGRVGLGTYLDAALGDPAVRAVAARVRYAARAFPTYPRAYPGAARIRLRDGTVRAAESAHPKGAPENPLTPAEVRAKFRENAGLALAPAAVRDLEAALLALEDVGDLRAALAPLAGARARDPLAAAVQPRSRPGWTSS